MSKIKSFMTAQSHKAFPLFEVTLIVALALIGWVAFGLYKMLPEVGERRRELAALVTEYSQISEFIQYNLTDLGAAFTNFSRTKDPVEKARFELRSQEFQKWLELENRRWEKAPRLPASLEWGTPQQLSIATNQSAEIQNVLLPLLSKIGNSYTSYQRAARYLLNNEAATAGKERIVLREQNMQRAKTRLLAFARQAGFRSEGMHLVLSSTQQGYGNFQNRFQYMGFALLLALVGLSFLLMLAIYRGKMAQSRQIIQQHKHQQIEQEAKLDKLAHFGRLAQELAHEIKQPLTAITARIYTLQKLLPPGADTHKDAAVIRDEIKRLDRILKDFLELARPAEPNLIPLAVGQALEEIRDLMAPQLEQEEIDLRFDCEDDLQILGDAQQLKQVLINLVKNAAESFNGGGTITLRARKTSREAESGPTETIALEVADNGPGIPPEIQDRIFDPFFSTKDDGTGLGLAIAAGIVDKHGGNLEFDTEPGRGTVFRIVLPAAAQNNMHEQSSAHRR